MQIKTYWRARLRAPSPFEPPPLYSTTLRFGAVAAVDLSLSCGLLWLVVQPSRAPFAFGGWVCGRALQLSEETVSVTFDLD